MPKAYVFFLTLIVISLGIRLSWVTSHQLLLHDGEEVNFLSRLTGSVSTSGQLQRFNLNYSGTRIFITTASFPLYSYGDRVEIKGRLRETTFSNGGHVFTLPFPKITEVPETNPFLRFGNQIRNYVSRLFHQNLPDTYASLLLGIVFGIKEQLPKNLESDFQITGVYHIMAASGMNVTFITSFFLASFGSFLKRQYTLVFSLCGIFLYILIAGFQPSILRASLMAGIVFTSQLLGRQSRALWVLLLTGWLMLMISPQLIADVGFQLSFLATLGILMLKPVFDQMIEKVPKAFDWVKEDIATTTAAQLFTIPILLSAFSQYGLLSILVNALILWTIPILMVLGSIAVLVSFVPLLSGLVLLFTMPIVWFVLSVIQFFGGFGLVLRIPPLPWAIYASYYLLVFGLLMIPKPAHEKNN